MVPLREEYLVVLPEASKVLPKKSKDTLRYVQHAWRRHSLYPLTLSQPHRLRRNVDEDDDLRLQSQLSAEGEICPIDAANVRNHGRRR
jgi:hypothetical protein